MDKKYSSGTQKRKLRKREDDLIAKVPKQALDHSPFPNELSPEFGESDVKFVCAEFGLSFSDLKFAYRNFKDSIDSVISNQLLKLKSVVNTILVSTAACKIGVSKMNIVM